MPFYAQHVRAAQTHLKTKDPTLRGIIRQVGPFRLKAERNGFHMLVCSIVSQQISTAAATTILNRLQERLQTRVIQVEHLQDLDPGALRSVGISQQKSGYLLDLVDKVSNQKLDLKALSKRPDEEIVQQLTQVKGIGVWTAHMFLMFSLARMDVLPVGDLGIKTAIQRHYGFTDLPTRAEIEEVSRPWRPYATIASWYLWRSLELDSGKRQ